ncbi:MAG TPA: cell division protein FtsQ/DivIB [Burkholderiaceae bacterium]
MAEVPQPPIDVRLMNWVASALFLCFGALVLAAGLWWVLRAPALGIGRIVVEGDLTHNNAVTLRANVAPKLEGNFFTVDLARTRDAFQAVPWVSKAVVRREFPGTLHVALEEYKPAAYWGDEDGSLLLDSRARVFEANVDEVEQDDLPRLQGPDSQAPDVLRMYQQLAPVFKPLDMEVTELALSGRGSWSAQLDGSAMVELGGGSQADVLARAARFVRTLTQVTAKYGRQPDALQSADLRHNDGYAVRLAGVTTVSDVSKLPKPAVKPAAKPVAKPAAKPAKPAVARPATH